MSNFLAIFASAAILFPFLANGTGHFNDLAITGADNVIAIYTEDHGWASAGEKELVLAVWPNGDCIFSADSIAGGPQFRQTQITEEVVRQLFQQIQESGFLESENLNAPRVPPDSKFTTILVRIGGKQLKMQSTHELASRRSLKIAGHDDDTASSPPIPPTRAAEVQNQKKFEIERDKGSDRKAASLFTTRIEQISSLTKDDLVHRVVWHELRMKMECIHLTPSKIAAGVLRQENGILSWQPSK